MLEGTYTQFVESQVATQKIQSECMVMFYFICIRKNGFADIAIICLYYLDHLLYVPVEESHFNTIYA